jgi:hypothetical protein
VRELARRRKRWNIISSLSMRTMSFTPLIISLTYALAEVLLGDDVGHAFWYWIKSMSSTTL